MLNGPNYIWVLTGMANVFEDVMQNDALPVPNDFVAFLKRLFSSFYIFKNKNELE
jgi:hypothetical protein